MAVVFLAVLKVVDNNDDGEATLLYLILPAGLRRGGGIPPGHVFLGEPGFFRHLH